MAKTPPPGRIGAADFKARCLELMERVRETGTSYVVTRHGVPIAKLVPVTGRKGPSLFGSMSDTVVTFEGPFDPIDGDYDIGR